MSDKHFLQFQREKTALKYFLIGRGFHLALKALGFVERYNVGLRKDGVTPSLHHEFRHYYCGCRNFYDSHHQTLLEVVISPSTRNREDKYFR